jgi:hypothetical protein
MSSPSFPFHSPCWRASSRTGRIIQPVVTGLSRNAARATEQAFIDLHGLAKNGGTLVNKIYSIARSSSAYQSAKQLGTSVLQELGIIE